MAIRSRGADFTRSFAFRPCAVEQCQRCVVIVDAIFLAQFQFESINRFLIVEVRNREALDDKIADVVEQRQITARSQFRQAGYVEAGRQ